MACEKEPSNAAGHNNLGLSYFEMKRFEDAAECFKEVCRTIFVVHLHCMHVYMQAISLDKSNATYFNNRGLCFYHMGGESLDKGLKVLS